MKKKVAKAEAPAPIGEGIRVREVEGDVNHRDQPVTRGDIVPGLRAGQGGEATAQDRTVAILEDEPDHRGLTANLLIQATTREPRTENFHTAENGRVRRVTSPLQGEKTHGLEA